MEEIISGIVAGSVLASAHLIQKWMTRRKEARAKAERASHSGIEFIEEINRKVRHALRRIRDEINSSAMRMHVLHFSNGTFTEAGLSLFKVSMKHELLLRYDIEPIAQNFQEKPIPDMFLKAVTHVVRAGQYYLKKKSDLDLTDQNDEMLFNWMSAYRPEIKSMYWVELRNHQKKMVAILCLHFPAEDALTHSQIVKIKDMKGEIEDIYNNLKK